MHRETTDEMCFSSFKSWPGTSRVKCKGEMWMGELGQDEDAHGIQYRHPACQAQAKVWDGENPFTGGSKAQNVKCPSSLPPRDDPEGDPAANGQTRRHVG